MKFKYFVNQEKFSNKISDEKLENYFVKFKEVIHSKDIGFFHLFEKTELLAQTKAMHEKFKQRKHFVQIGIGGSALGPQMLVNALGDTSQKSFTLLDNIDPDYIKRELSKINLTDSVFYIVSKSGGTAETLACYAIVKNLLEDAGVLPEEMRKYFIFCTENKSSELYQHIEQEKFEMLEIPLNIGGRFSVLSPVGLFPAIFFDVDITQLWQGAKDLQNTMLNEELHQNPLVQCCKHVLNLKEHQVDQTVLMPYSSLLKDFSFWFVQLWAESLGKWSEKNQSHTGLTPVPAYGATDQHSQVQLFMEGPNQKLIFMLGIDKTQSDYSLKNDLPITRATKLSPYKLNDLMLAEFAGTVKALTENDRPVIQINIPEITPSSVGGLILFFESLTTIVGHALDINPFDQPGVEKGKIFAFEYLEKL